MSDTLTKRCTKCGRELPATAEWFKVDKTTKSGLRSTCHECERIYYQSPEYKAQQKARRQTPEYKAQEKARKQTPAYKAKAKAYGKAYRQSPEKKAKKKAYSQSPAYKAYEKTYNQSPKGKARSQKYRQSPKNKTRIKAYAQLAKYKAQQKSYWQSPEGQSVLKAASHRRLARKRDLPDTFTATDWLHALEYFNHRCAVCERPTGLWHTLAPDHWIPLADTEHCPGTIPTNIVPLCHDKKDGAGGCNNSKCNKNAHEWLMERYSVRQVAKIEKRIAAYFASLTTGETVAL